jgi:hypothetical protein
VKVIFRGLLLILHAVCEFAAHAHFFVLQGLKSAKMIYVCMLHRFLLCYIPVPIMLDGLGRNVGYTSFLCWRL